MDLKQLMNDTLTTNSTEHMMTLQQHVNDQFWYDQEIEDIVKKKTKAHQTITMKSYVNMYCTEELQYDLYELLKTFKDSTEKHVLISVRGIITSAQEDIYKLVHHFDSDDFRNMHMSPKMDGSCIMNYWDHPHDNDMSNWRKIIDVEMHKITALAAKQIEFIHSICDLDRDEFTLHPANAKWFDRDAKQASTRKLDRNHRKKQKPN
jgi:hypothetical protein